jgi:hypothetical protein
MKSAFSHQQRRHLPRQLALGDAPHAPQLTGEVLQSVLVGEVPKIRQNIEHPGILHLKLLQIG